MSLRFAAVSVLLAGTVWGQSSGDDARPPVVAPAIELAVQESLLDAPLGDLQILLVPLSADKLEALANTSVERLELAANELSLAIVEQSHQEAGAELTDDDERLGGLVDAKQDLIARSNMVLDAFAAKGGDVAKARAYLAAVQALEPPRSTAATADGDEAAPENTEVGAQVDALVEAIRDQPPAHARSLPWTVPVREFELELQPLAAEQIDERVRTWIDILQRELRARIRLDIALTTAKDVDVRNELASRSAKQQEVIQAIVERIEVALVMLQRRGGDPKPHRDYITSATGQKIELTDPAVMYAQVAAWMRSADGGVKVGLNVLKFLGILIAFWLASKILGRIASVAVGRVPKASTLLRDFVVGGTRRVVFIIGIVIAISALGVNITPLLAAIGAIGLVIGLALQGTLSNFASGLLILIYRPFDVGDVIDAGGVVGKVEAMTLMSTSVLTLDNRAMYVPNNEIWNGVITNVTGQRTRRIDLMFGIGYGDDIAKAITLVEEITAAHPKVLEDPKPIVRVHELGDNSVNLIARPWAQTVDYWDVYWDLMRQVKERFDAEGLNIPFPQRDLHVPGTIEVRLASNGTSSANGGSLDARADERAPVYASTGQPADAAPSRDIDGDDTE